MTSARLAREPVRLLALDLDGTLLDSRKEISARNLAALQAALDAGVRIALITGRRYPAAKRISARVPGNPVLVLHNGGLVMEGEAPIRACTGPRARSPATGREPHGHREQFLWIP